MWIKRDISSLIQKNQDLIQVVRGPRQCGKSSLLFKLDEGFEEASLDDPALRILAQDDPELFLSQFQSGKIFIDEAQYAPNLFPSLKRRADLHRRGGGRNQTIIRITGSNQILMDRSVKESLAGRASFFEMNTLSVAEILASKEELPGVGIQEILYRGGWPELYAHHDAKNPKKYLDDYINSYIEKDVVLSAGIQKSREFLTFTKLLAGRVGQILDFTGLARDSGVDATTVKEWISVLEQMHIIRLLQPYSSNLSKRLIKSPKVYFIDTGLACRLQGWTSSAPILTSPQQGHLFENLVFSELHKMKINLQLDWEFFHWRSKDGEEIDFLIKMDPKRFLFIEAKVSSGHPPKHADFREVKKVFGTSIPELLVCHQEGNRVLNKCVPIALLKQELLER